MSSDSKSILGFREMTYRFFNLPYLSQTQILVDLKLIDEVEKGMRYSEIFNKIIQKATEANKLEEFFAQIIDSEEKRKSKWDGRS